METLKRRLAAQRFSVQMPSERSQDRLDAAIREYWQSVESFDPVRYSSNFAPDGTLEDPVGTPAIRGREAIAAFYAGGIQTLASATAHVRDIFGDSTERAVRWEIVVRTKQGMHAVIQGIGIFRFKPPEPGERVLLKSVREFFDPTPFETLLSGGSQDTQQIHE